MQWTFEIRLPSHEVAGYDFLSSRFPQDIAMLNARNTWRYSLVQQRRRRAPPKSTRQRLNTSPATCLAASLEPTCPGVESPPDAALSDPPAEEQYVSAETSVTNLSRKHWGPLVVLMPDTTSIRWANSASKYYSTDSDSSMRSASPQMKEHALRALPAPRTQNSVCRQAGDEPSDALVTKSPTASSPVLERRSSSSVSDEDSKDGDARCLVYQKASDSVPAWVHRSVVPKTASARRAVWNSIAMSPALIRSNAQLVLKRALCTCDVAAVRTLAAIAPHVLADAGFVLLGAVGEGALVTAAEEGQVAMVSTMLSLGVDPDANAARAQERDGWTPLHAATYRGHAPCVVALLRGGAHVDTLSTSGLTALHVAAIHDRADCAMALLDAGAKTSAMDQANRTPADYANLFGNQEFLLATCYFRPSTP